MALSADKNTRRGKVHGRTQDYIIKSSAQVYLGSLAALDTNGVLLPVAHGTASLKFVGSVISYEGTGLGDGTYRAVVERRGTAWYTHAGTATAGMKGKMAYAVDDATVTDDPTAVTNVYRVGKIINVDTTANEVEIDFEDRVPAGVIAPMVPTATVAATGSAQGDAAAITDGFTLVTAADATKGVVLPAALPGRVAIVKNADAANAVLKIYPASGDAINALSANAALSIAAKTSVILISYDSTTWYSIPLLPS